MAWVQGVSVQGNGVTSVTTAALTTTSGNALAVGAGVQIAFGGDVTSVTDSKSNTLTEVSSSPVGTTEPKSRLYTAKNITGGSSHTWTTNVGSNSYIVMGIGEFSGRDTTNLVDTDASAINAVATTIITGPSFTPVANADLFLFECNNSADNPETTTPGGSWTTGNAEPDGSNGTAGHSQYQNNVSAVLVTGSFTTTTSVKAAAIMVSLKAASGGGAPALTLPYSYQRSNTLLRM